jgi:catechol 2,3-dioxygenase
VADQEPIFDIAHLGHVEMLTPKLDESVKFFVNIWGMQECGRKGDSVYLRAWDDYERATLKVTAATQPGMGHFAFRTRSQQALDRRVKVLEASGAGVGWIDGDVGHGPAYQFRDPDGHLVEVYYETEWYQAPPELKPALKNQAQKFPGRGVNVRRLDHLNLLASDVTAVRTFMEDKLGMRMTEQIVLDSGIEAGGWVTSNNKSYDVAIARDHTGANGRLHHFTYATDTREEILRAADIYLENGIFIETGPHKHAIQRPSSSIATSRAAIGWRSQTRAHA